MGRRQLGTPIEWVEEDLPYVGFWSSDAGCRSDMRERGSVGRDGGRLSIRRVRDGFSRKGEGGKSVLADIDGWSATRLGVFDDGSFVVGTFIPLFLS
jgi:hypothetical protein